MNPQKKIDNVHSVVPSSHSLMDFNLHLADNALILGHRNSEWTGHGPILEQDIALSNIALDLIGQARNFYQYAALLRNDGATEDSLAYLRDTNEFLNCQLVEQPNGDWGNTVLKQFFFSAYQYYLYQQLQTCNDLTIAAIAEKALKEVNYHLRWSSEWVIRLGDGTTESHRRMNNAVQSLWNYTGELFIITGYEASINDHGINFDLQLIRKQWEQKVSEIFEEAQLTLPGNRDTDTLGYGKNGVHTPHLNELLSEMQFMQRKFPDSQW